MNADIHFQADEVVRAKIRKHWIILLRDTIGTLVLAFIPFVLLAVLQIFIPASANFSSYFTYMAFATTLWFLVIWLALAVLWTDYYLDLWIVTNQRIISIDQVGLFNRKVTTISLDRIQEITVTQENILQTFLHYGTLEIESASPTDGDVTMEGIPHPEYVRKVILEQHTKK